VTAANDDVNAIALSENKALHFWVPAAGLVSEVNTVIQQLSRRYDGHGCTPIS